MRRVLLWNEACIPTHLIKYVSFLASQSQRAAVQIIQLQIWTELKWPTRLRSKNNQTCGARPARRCSHISSCFTRITTTTRQSERRHTDSGHWLSLPSGCSLSQLLPHQSSCGSYLTCALSVHASPACLQGVLGIVVRVNGSSQMTHLAVTGYWGARERQVTHVNTEKAFSRCDHPSCSYWARMDSF